MTQTRYAKYLGATGVHGHYGFEQTFQDGINVLYGANGAGKTTLLHILVNLLNSDYDRFAFLQFKTVKLEMSDGEVIRLERFRPVQDSGGPAENATISVWRNERWYHNIEVEPTEAVDPSLRPISSAPPTRALSLKFPPMMPTTYFPAFRVGADALRMEFLARRRLHDSESEAHIDVQVDHAIRRWLLPFIPSLSYPSRTEIERTLSSAESHVDVGHFDIDRYLDLVNSFLEGKSLSIAHDPGRADRSSVVVIYDDGFRARGLSVLSSGEYQITSIAYSALALPKNGVLLIDEPEISLQLEWQRNILEALNNVTRCGQLIACTHSPAIASNYEMSEVKLTSVPFDLDEEIPF